MSPWEEIEWFQMPVVSTFTVNNAAAPVILTFDPMRVGVTFSIFSGPDVAICPDAPLTPGQTAGIVLTKGAYPLTFTHEEWGIMVHAEWFATGQAAQNSIISTIEIRLKGWPKQKTNILEMLRSGFRKRRNGVSFAPFTGQTARD